MFILISDVCVLRRDAMYMYMYMYVCVLPARERSLAGSTGSG